LGLGFLCFESLKIFVFCRSVAFEEDLQMIRFSCLSHVLFVDQANQRFKRHSCVLGNELFEEEHEQFWISVKKSLCLSWVWFWVFFCVLCVLVFNSVFNFFI